MTSLVRSGQPQDADADELRLRMTQLETALCERAAALEQLKSDLAAFKIRYRDEVGLLHEQLEELERAIADAELGEITKRLEEGGRAPGPAPARPPDDPAPRFTSDAVRRLFRDVAKAIHPDLASDDLTRDRRHALMIEANRAYALGDEDRLRWILQAWERSPAIINDDASQSARVRFAHRIAALEERIEICDLDLAAVKDTALWKLKTMVDESAARGKNLVADTVRRLKRDIVAARNRLDAMQSHP